MRKNKTAAMLVGVAVLGSTLVSCKNYSLPTRTDKENVTPSMISKESVTVNLSSDTLYAPKIENLNDDFILGMDASSVISEEESGVKYYDYEGKESDVFKTLAESGINYIRVRIWNDPYDSEGHGYGGGNNDIDKAVEIGKRATKYGMKLLANFHYSDFWADPKKQKAPKEWANYDIYKKSDALYNYTYDSLLKLYSAGVDVGMVQIGNETTTNMADAGDWDKVCMLFNAGSKASKEVFPDALVALHFTNPEIEGRYVEYGESLKKNNVNYDVFATSYYPYWHGTLENLTKTLNDVSNKFNKKVMIAETSYAYTTKDTDLWGNTIGTEKKASDTYDYPISIAGQANHVSTLVNTAVNKINNCIGVFYWEGTWISVGSNFESNKSKWEKYGSGWASSYAKEYDPDDAGKWYGGCAVENQAFFDEKGMPLESLKIWGLMKKGNTNVPKYAEGAEDISIAFNIKDEIKLPTTANVIYNDNSRVPTNVTWDFPDSIKNSIPTGGDNYYTIKGKVAGYDVICTLHIIEKNYIKNDSFEEDTTNWNVKIQGKASESYKVAVTAENPKIGKNAFHFWAKEENTVKFSVEQEIKDLETGKYAYYLSILGGAGSKVGAESKQNIYMYVKIDGEIKYKTDMKFTNYDAGYKKYELKFDYTKGQKIIVGFYCEANESGSWGDFDEAMLNLVG